MQSRGTVSKVEYACALLFIEASLCASILQDDEESGSAAAPADMKRRWREQQDDVLFPDEVRPLLANAF